MSAGPKEEPVKMVRLCSAEGEKGRIRKAKRIRQGLHLPGQVRPLRKVSLSLNNIELAAALLIDKKLSMRAFSFLGDLLSSLKSASFLVRRSLCLSISEEEFMINYQRETTWVIAVRSAQSVLES